MTVSPIGKPKRHSAVRGIETEQMLEVVRQLTGRERSMKTPMLALRGSQRITVSQCCMQKYKCSLTGW